MQACQPPQEMRPSMLHIRRKPSSGGSSWTDMTIDGGARVLLWRVRLLNYGGLRYSKLQKIEYFEFEYAEYDKLDPLWGAKISMWPQVDGLAGRSLRVKRGTVGGWLFKMRRPWSWAWQAGHAFQPWPAGHGSLLPKCSLA